MKLLLPFFPLALCLAQTQDVTGDWLGTLNRPTGPIRLALHITRADNTLKATLDAVDQGVNGIPLDSIKLADSKLTFDLKSVQGSFDGKVDAAAAAIEGTLAGESWSMPLTFRRGAVPKVEHKPAKPTDIDGDWAGTLAEQAYVIHITNTEDGLIATMDAPGEKVKGAEASSVKRNDSTLSIEWKVFGSQFEGKIAADRSAIEGTVTQAGQTYPLNLKRLHP